MAHSFFTFLTSDEEDDILQSKKVAQKSRENGGLPGTSGSGRTADTSQLKPTKPKSSPVKFTATSVQDFFGSGSVHRSSKKLVTSKRKAVRSVCIMFLFLLYLSMIQF